MARRWQKQLARGAIFWGLKTLAGCSRALPWHLGVWLGGKLGRLSLLFLSRERNTAAENLRLAFGGEKSIDEIKRIMGASFENLGKGLIEILKMSRLRRHELESLVMIEGEEHLKRAYAEGRGVILITGHIGNWELMGAVLALRGYPLHGIAAPLFDPRIDEWISASRASFDIETISRGTPSSSRRILSVLRRKEVLCLLIDQDTKVDGVFVDFFNRKAYTPSGAASLALRSGAVTLLCFIVRLPGNRHRVTIGSPIQLTSTGDHSKDLIENTALFTREIEAWVREHPEQWVWLHRRWKTQAPRREEEATDESS